jgi:hypothetical protein
MIGEGGSGPEEVGSTDGACMTTGANGAAFSVKAAARSSGQNIAYDINRSPAILNSVRNGPNSAGLHFLQTADQFLRERCTYYRHK